MAGTLPGRKASTEQRILSTAASLFARFGYNGVSTRDIAIGAEVNEVTVYRHYSRKRDLYLAVLDAELGEVRLHGDLLAQIAEAANVQTAVNRTLDLVAMTLKRQPELLRLIQFGALECSDDLEPLFRRHLGELIKVVAHYMDPWIGRGELRCSSSKALVLTMVAIVLSQRSLHRIFSEDGGTQVFDTCAEALCVIQSVTS
jgi:AcrR family transcriptional regulator